MDCNTQLCPQLSNRKTLEEHFSKIPSVSNAKAKIERDKCCRSDPVCRLTHCSKAKQSFLQELDVSSDGRYYSPVG